MLTLENRAAGRGCEARLRARREFFPSGATVDAGDPRELEKVLYYAASIVTWVDDDKRAEVEALSRFAKANAMALHMDGARFANAVAARTATIRSERAAVASAIASVKRRSSRLWVCARRIST